MIIRTTQAMIPTTIMVVVTWCSGACIPDTAGVSGRSRSAGNSAIFGPDRNVSVVGQFEKARGEHRAPFEMRRAEHFVFLNPAANAEAICELAGTRALARVRGFALEIADFEIFYLAKYLICNERRLRFQSKTAVVKTYPIPKLGWFRVDSSHHVSAPHRAKEERQVAPLLERGGEQAPR
jgi:hypothetical protein